MASNDEGKNGKAPMEKAKSNHEETLDKKCARVLKKVTDFVDVAKKGVVRTKEKLRIGHASIVENIRKIGEHGHDNVIGGNGNEKLVDKNDNVSVEIPLNLDDNERLAEQNDNEKLVQQNDNVYGHDCNLDDVGFRDNVEGRIELVDDFSGIEAISETEFDAIVSGLGNEWSDSEIVGDDKAGGDSNIVGDNETGGDSKSKSVGDDSVSEEFNYIGESNSSDTNESLDDDYEKYTGSDESEGDDVGQNHSLVPVEDSNGLTDLDGHGSEDVFMIGMTFSDKDDLRRAIDRYAIKNGVNVKISRSNKSLVIVTCEASYPFRLYASRDESNVGFKV